jgi:hypothetical protein
MTQLSHPASYNDVQLGTIATQPVFSQAAAVPGS